MEGEVISVYSKEMAIEDGVLFKAGKCNGHDVILTTHLMADLSKEELVQAAVRGLEEFARFKGPDLREYWVGKHRLWVDFNGSDATLMFPEDY